MSIKLMSAIFETEFRDLPMGEDDKHSKASSIKIIMLAIADHANDDGEGSYPGITRLEKKTGLSRQGVVDTIKTCKYNGLLFVMDEPSRLGTNDYRVNLDCFPLLKDASQATLLVKPLDYPSQATLPVLVKPLDSNHPLTTIESSIGADAPNADNLPLDWKIAKGMDITEKDLQDETDRKMRDSANLIATGFGVNSTAAYNLAYAFQVSRWIIIPNDKVKGQRKAVKEMLEMHVKPEHVEQAVKDLTAKSMTITDLYSVSKTAIALANPAPVENEKPEPYHPEYEKVVADPEQEKKYVPIPEHLKRKS
jgi:hypothetical protein